MSGLSQLHVKPAEAARSARPPGRFVFRFRAYVVAIVAALLPLSYLVSIVACTGLAIWHSHRMVMVMNFDANFGWQDFRLLVWVALEVTGALLLVRQVITPSVKGSAWQELMPGDQQQLFGVIKLVAEKVGAPMPEKVIVDSTANMRADYPGSFATLRRKQLCLRMGLSLPVGLSGAELVAALAHELGFHGKGSGASSARFIRGVHRWFDLRIRHDPWLEALRKRARFADGVVGRWCWWLLWSCVWLSLRPLRLLYAFCRVLTGTTMELMVRQADECASRLAGSQALASMLLKRASAEHAWADADEMIKATAPGQRLPDNLPLLVARSLSQPDGMFTMETIGKERTHWIDCAPRDTTRLRYIQRWKHEGIAEALCEGTDFFRNFHELARRITFFHYQNNEGKSVSEHMLVPVEERVHEQRASMEIVQVLNRYFRGLAHPERAFCGIAEEQTALRDPELLRLELLDCREWLDTYSERMSSVLTEWSATWQLVRDLEMGYLLAKSGLPVIRGQFTISSLTPESFREEIERHRGIMDNLEGLLREYEGRLETRLACALELLWRANEKDLPPKIAAVRATLPNWVLVYEALGLHLPVLRELMTHFHAFQALGASQSGTVDSAAFITAVQTEIPRLARLVNEIVSTLSQWPYPFKNEQTKETLSLAAFVAPLACEPGALDFEFLKTGDAGDRRLVTQNAAKRIAAMITPLMDRYLSLYHQSFAWVTKSADMAEWHFVDPFDPNTKITDLQDRQRAVRHVEPPPPPSKEVIDPEVEYAMQQVRPNTRRLAVAGA